MKKNLILSLCMLLGVTACQKENKKPVDAVDKTKLSLTFVHDVVQPIYTDLQLMPDGSYEGWWNDCAIRVTGNPAWDLVKYPTLVNGVPVVAMEFSTYDGTSNIVSYNTGLAGNVFQVSQTFISLPTFSSTGFVTDLNGYLSAVSTWSSTLTGPPASPAPEIGNYIKDTYTYVPNSGPQVKIFTGKLIRVTTGSHLAIASINFPLATAAPVQDAGFINIPVSDKNFPTVTYQLQGSNNIITSAKIGGTTYRASGIYKRTPGTFIYHLVGTIIRADGTPSDFDVIEDIS